MNDSSENRATRRGKARRAKTAVLAGAAAAAMTFGLAVAPGVAPEAKAIDATWNPTYTAGAIAAVLNWFGETFPGTTVAGGLYDSGPPQSVNLSLDAGTFGMVNLTLLLKNLASDTPNLYNTIAQQPQTGGCRAGLLSSRFADTCRYSVGLMTTEADLNMVEAVRAQIQSVTTGVTPAGLVPFVSSPTATAQLPNYTGELLGFVQNPLRPNGGFYSRYPDWSQFFGVDPTMVAAGRYLSQDRKIALNLSTLDVTWAYDPSSDLPETFNLLASANSALAALPINLLTGTDTKLVIADALGNPVTTTAIGLDLAQFLQVSPANLLGAPGDGRAYYVTAVSDQLPILTPMRLPGFAINALLKAVNSPYLLGNPAADAIEPALKILINTAYTDVLPPDRLDQCATACGTSNAQTYAQLGYQAYDRSFLQAHVPTPFNSVETLTPEEKDAVPGDAWDAFKTGVQEQLDKPFWGIIVPNPDNPPQEVTPPAAVQAASAVAVSAPDPEVVAPVEVSAVADSAPAVSVADEAAADDAAAVSVSADEDSAPAVSPRSGAHRRGSVDAGNSDAPSSAASGGRNRSAD